MGSINPHIAQNSPGVLCEKWAIADFDVRTWLPQKLEPKKEAGYIQNLKGETTMAWQCHRVLASISATPSRKEDPMLGIKNMFHSDSWQFQYPLTAPYPYNRNH